VDRNWFLNDLDIAELRDLPHRLRLTIPHNGNKIFNVRCTCMSGVTRPSSRFSGYDKLGTAESLPEAIGLWQAHIEKGT
jgi:hypothetical protein